MDTGNDTNSSGVVTPNISLPLSGEGTRHLLEAGGSPVCLNNQDCHLCEEKPEQLHQTSAEHWDKEILEVGALGTVLCDTEHQRVLMGDCGSRLSPVLALAAGGCSHVNLDAAEDTW